LNAQELREQIGLTVERLVAPQLGDLFSAASLEIRYDDELIYTGSFGTDMAGEPVRASTLFDLGALTELFTTTAFLRLVDAGRLWIDTPVNVVLENAAENVTFYHLLTHTSGYPATFDLCRYADYEQRIAAAEAVKPVHPLGSQVLHSPLNFIQMGLAVEALTMLPLEQAIALLVLQPLDLRAEYAPLSSHAHVAPVTSDVERHAIDRNVRCLDDVAGHAGLFGTVTDITTLAQVYVEVGMHNATVILSGEMAAEATREHFNGVGLGWQFSGDICGHTSPTGVQILVDMPRRLVLSLLTNCAGETDSPNRQRLDSLWAALFADIQRLADESL